MNTIRYAISMFPFQFFPTAGSRDGQQYQAILALQFM